MTKHDIRLIDLNKVKYKLIVQPDGTNKAVLLDNVTETPQGEVTMQDTTDNIMDIDDEALRAEFDSEFGEKLTAVKEILLLSRLGPKVLSELDISADEWASFLREHVGPQLAPFVHIFRDLMEGGLTWQASMINTLQDVPYKLSEEAALSLVLQQTQSMARSLGNSLNNSLGNKK